MEATAQQLQMPHVDADVFELVICYFITDDIEYITTRVEARKALAAEEERAKEQKPEEISWDEVRQRRRDFAALYLEERANLWPLLQLSVLADELGLGVLELHVAHRLSYECFSDGRSFSPTTVEWILENTRELSPLREPLRDNLKDTICSHRDWAGIYRNGAGIYRNVLESHPEFAVDLLMDMQ
jgi:hypothetical protein